MQREPRTVTRLVRDYINRQRPRAADLLIGWAYRIDPHRPAARTHDGGGWTISVGSMDLATVVAPGVVNDLRPNRAERRSRRQDRF